jgi:hypothetical protein
MSTGFFTAGAAGTGVATPVSGDTFVVPNFIAGNAYLEQVWAEGASTDFVQIHSARMHDNNQGIRLRVAGALNVPLIPFGAAQGLYSGDAPAVQIDETAAATGAIAVVYSFDDMPGVQPRLASWGDVSARIANISAVEVLVSAVAAIGQYSPGVAINSTFDNFQADSDYALLGYDTSASVLAVAVAGQDTGNLKMGGPGPADPKVTRDWFVRLDRETGRAAIPIIAANNKGGTLVFQTDNTAAAAQRVTLIMAQLK